jgi:prephenate dehydratase
MLGIKTGEKLLISHDAQSGAIVIEPAHEKKLLYLEIGLSDEPGSLAKAANALAKINVDLVSTASRSSRRGEAAIWSVQCNPGKTTMAQIRKALGKIGATLDFCEWK